VHGFPDGAFGGAFPDGIQGNPSYSERHFRFESSFLNNGLSKHKPLFNVGAEYIEVYDVYETRNYIQDPQTGFPIAPLPGLVEVPEDERYSKDAQRTVVFGLVQDEWNFAPDWSFTGGLRYDYYSDIGDTANPRLALVWATNERLTSKLLVGRGFRAPTFLELSDQKSLSAQGNPELKPVLNSSVDMSFNYVTSYNSNVNLSLFYHELEDQISFVNTPPAGEQAQNVSGQKGYGLELDGRWKISKEFIISGYYAYQFNEEREVKEDSGLGPRNQILIRGDWKATKWRVDAIALWVADRQREKNDTREPLDDELTIDLNILYETNNWSLGLKVNNLFNEQRNAPGEISSQDIPLPERNVFASVKYSY
jgi:iron complex outermembrane receptor protein